ncbi:PIG-L family deacetylase [Actinomycetospora lutea]|uniref:PIG-L deacetylase family protein n=1 Tax=Actinomycetospora lutea TaxID=663604 RepID=UPI002367373F|nr:PIG-L family deacetylase [Actinomycetospora lutea]MDD7942310.1 PIG-L family deacetylase [Actinomycetospora lutea]
MTGTLLGVWAHPDDETFLSSGLILAAHERGDRVVLVTATRGERGTDDPGTWPPERLGRLRERELESALAVLGVDEHRFLGHGDGTCHEAAEPLAARAVATVIEDVRPDTIVTFGPDGVTGHADHRAVGRWATRARNTVAPEVELLRAVLAPGFTRRFAAVNARFGVFMDDPAEEVVDPGLHLRLEGARLDRKIEAMLAQDSQTRRLVEGVGLAAFRSWWAEEAFLVDRPAAARAA